MIPWWAFLIGMVLGAALIFIGALLGGALVLGGKQRDESELDI